MSTEQETRYTVQGQASAEYPFVIWDDKYHRFVAAHATGEEAEEAANHLNSLDGDKEMRMTQNENQNENVQPTSPILAPSTGPEERVSLSALGEFELARASGFATDDDFVARKERYPEAYERWYKRQIRQAAASDD
jgi:hypothetical protein